MIQKGVSLGFQSTEGDQERHKKEEVLSELRRSFSPEFLQPDRRDRGLPPVG